MAKPKGSPKTGGGSRKGCPNRTTKLIKEMVIQALTGAGGVEYLQRQADLNPSAFLTLVGKVLPLQITGEGDGPLTVQVIGYADHHASV